MGNQKQIYRSFRQIAYIGMEDEVTIYGNRTITIDGTSFIVELPDDTVLKGTLTYQKLDGNKKIFSTDKGCPFVFIDNTIFLNLYKTHNALYEYILEND